MRKAYLFCGFFLCALIGFSGCNKTKVHVGQDGNDEENQSDNHQEVQPVVWVGPGWYYGLWFGTQLDLLYWNRHYYNYHYNNYYNYHYHRDNYQGDHGYHNKNDRSRGNNNNRGGGGGRRSGGNSGARGGGGSPRGGGGEHRGGGGGNRK